MRFACLVLIVFAGCGGKPAAKTPELEDLEPDVSEREARDLIEEAYGSLRRGDAVGLLPLLAPDIFVLGPRVSDVDLGGSEALVMLGDALEALKVKKHKIKSRDLSVIAAAGGHSAWATDQLEVNGATYAMTAILTHADDLWVIAAVHVARTIPDKQLKKKIKAGEVRAGAQLAPADPDPATKDVLALAEAGIPDLAELLDQFPDVDTDLGADVVVVGTAPKAVAHGVKKIRKAWKKVLKDDPPVIELAGEPRVGLTPDGALAWVTANVTRAREDEAPVPHRMFYLYARDDDAWRLVAVHDAVVIASAK